MNPLTVQDSDAALAPVREFVAATGVTVPRLLVHCREAMEGWQRPPTSALADRDPRVVLLARLVVDYLLEVGRRMPTAVAGVEWVAGVAQMWARVRPRFVLADDLAHLLQPDTATAWTAAFVGEVIGLSNDFRARLAPTRLGSLQNTPTRYAARVHAFVDHRDRSDASLEAFVRSRFQQHGIVSGADADRIICRLGRVPSVPPYDPFPIRAGLWRLRVYGEGELQDIATNYLAWDATVCDIESGGLPAVSNLWELLVAQLRHQFGQQLQPADLEDIAQELLLRLQGYTYESPLPAWLFQVAVNLALGVVGIGPPPPPPPPVRPSPAEIEESLAEMWPDHVLIRSTFPLDRWREVDVLWAQLADQIGGAEPLPIEDLQCKLNDVRDPDKSLETPHAASQFHRLYRMRWIVVERVRNSPPGPPLTDDCVLNAVVKHCGKSIQPDVSVRLRRLAALARVSVRHGTPVWATYATLCVDEKLDTANAEDVVLAETLVPELDLRRAMRRAFGPDDRRAFDLAGALKGQRLGHWSAAVALLRFVEGLSAQEIASILLASGDERQRLADALAAAEAVTV